LHHGRALWRNDGSEASLRCGVGHWRLYKGTLRLCLLRRLWIPLRLRIALRLLRLWEPLLRVAGREALLLRVARLRPVGLLLLLRGDLRDVGGTHRELTHHHGPVAVLRRLPCCLRTACVDGLLHHRVLHHHAPRRDGPTVVTERGRRRIHRELRHHSADLA